VLEPDSQIVFTRSQEAFNVLMDRRPSARASFIWFVSGPRKQFGNWVRRIEGGATQRNIRATINGNTGKLNSLA